MPVATELDDLPYAEFLVRHDGSDLAAEQRYDTVHFDDLTVTGATGATFTECAFTSVSFDDGDFRRARFNDVWMNPVRLVGPDLAESEWLDSSLAASVLAGVIWFSSSLQRVTFEGCKLDSANFRGAELTDVTFKDCVLQDADFGEARLSRVSFGGSALRRVRLDKATLAKVDLRGATELDLASGHDALRGATIDNLQLVQLAPHLANVLGITVKDS